MKDHFQKAPTERDVVAIVARGYIAGAVLVESSCNGGGRYNAYYRYRWDGVDLRISRTRGSVEIGLEIVGEQRAYDLVVVHAALLGGAYRELLSKYEELTFEESIVSAGKVAVKLSEVLAQSSVADVSSMLHAKYLAFMAERYPGGGARE